MVPLDCHDIYYMRPAFLLVSSPNAFPPQEIAGLIKGVTLPETNSSHLKIDGWNTILSFWGKFGLFSGAFAVSFREGRPHFLGETWHWGGYP